MQVGKKKIFLSVNNVRVWVELLLEEKSRRIYDANKQSLHFFIHFLFFCYILKMYFFKKKKKSIFADLVLVRGHSSCSECSLSLPPTEEVVDCHQSDCGRFALRGRGQLLAEALLSAAARLRPDVQQPLDVLQAALQGLQASPGLRQHPQAGGEPTLSSRVCVDICQLLLRKTLYAINIITCFVRRLTSIHDSQITSFRSLFWCYNEQLYAFFSHFSSHRHYV